MKVYNLSNLTFLKNFPMFLKKIKYFILTLYFFITIIFFFRRINFIIFFHFWKRFKIDTIRFWILLICIFLLVRVIISSFQIRKSLYVLVFLLFIFFLEDRLILFFFFFERILIPIILIIIFEGKNQERTKAAFYIFSYTLISSLPLLFFIFLIFKKSFIFFSIKFYFRNIFIPFFFLILLAFFVKIPIFFFHAWLPKAHVEASTIGSIFLAGCLLKLGSYGIFRFLNIFYTVFFPSFFVRIGLIARLTRRLICLIQTDRKIIIAYSSVVHIRINLIIFFIIKDRREYRIILINLRHSFISRALFLGFGIIYNWSKRRRNLILKGILSLFPIFSLGWLLCCRFNISLPPSIGFFGEIFLIKNLLIFYTNYIPFFIIIFLLLFIGVYCLLLFTLISHGKFFHKISFIKKNELLIFYFIFINRINIMIFLDWL